MIKYNESIIIGTKFTALTTIGKAFYCCLYNSKQNNKEVVVICKCKCGNIGIYSVNFLINRRIISCGCNKRSPLKNKSFRIQENSVYINLDKNVLILDLNIFEKIKENSIHDGTRYPIISLRNPSKQYVLHRYIMDFPQKEIDHINSNRYDCRKQNLRLSNRQQNTINSTSRMGSSSKYKGVCWDKSRNKWTSKIKINGSSKYLGRFSSEEDAAKAYDEAARKYHCEFGKYNFPLEKEQSALRIL